MRLVRLVRLVRLLHLIKDLARMVRGFVGNFRLIIRSVCGPVEGIGSVEAEDVARRASPGMLVEKLNMRA